MSITPYNRRETYIAALSDNSVTIPDYPLTRWETYMAKINGEPVSIPASPCSREEIYLAKLAGEDVTVPSPVSRLEMFLYKACGNDITPPDPVTREEELWNDYINSAPALAISVQPEPVTVVAGQTATFSVTPTGGTEPYAYRWQYLRPNTTSWTNISSNGRSQTYTLTTETRHNGNLYRCQVTDAAETVVYSESALLTVTEE